METFMFNRKLPIPALQSISQSLLPHQQALVEQMDQVELTQPSYWHLKQFNQQEQRQDHVLDKFIRENRPKQCKLRSKQIVKQQAREVQRILSYQSIGKVKKIEKKKENQDLELDCGEDEQFQDKVLSQSALELQQELHQFKIAKEHHHQIQIVNSKGENEDVDGFSTFRESEKYSSKVAIQRASESLHYPKEQEIELQKAVIVKHRKRGESKGAFRIKKQNSQATLLQNLEKQKELFNLKEKTEEPSRAESPAMNPWLKHKFSTQHNQDTKPQRSGQKMILSEGISPQATTTKMNPLYGGQRDAETFSKQTSQLFLNPYSMKKSSSTRTFLSKPSTFQSQKELISQKEQQILKLKQIQKQKEEEIFQKRFTNHKNAVVRIINNTFKKVKQAKEQEKIKERVVKIKEKNDSKRHSALLRLSARGNGAFVSIGQSGVFETKKVEPIFTVQDYKSPAEALQRNLSEKRLQTQQQTRSSYYNLKGERVQRTAQSKRPTTKQEEEGKALKAQFQEWVDAQQALSRQEQALEFQALFQQNHGVIENQRTMEDYRRLAGENPYGEPQLGGQRWETEEGTKEGSYQGTHPDSSKEGPRPGTQDKALQQESGEEEAVELPRVVVSQQRELVDIRHYPSEEATPATVLHPRHSLPYKDSRLLTSVPASREGPRPRSRSTSRQVRSGSGSRAELLKLKVEVPHLRDSFTQ